MIVPQACACVSLTSRQKLIWQNFIVDIRNGVPDVHLIFADWLSEIGEEERSLMVRSGVVKRYGIDFESPGGALTLDAEEVCETGKEDGYHTRTHEDGWTVSGEICEDYFVWVNDFIAIHPTLGRVEGNFEDLVFASTEEAFQNFYENHQPHAWDYGDI